MASKSSLNLPPITPELKVIGPYLQRAEEVKNQEPIVAYWCAYYAAQVGIGLKSKDPSSRELLLALLGALEKLKNEIGSNDAISVDAAGAAYVENFALKVFGSADNEDRAGRASKATAKKFLAAAHFLEVLKSFSQSEISESVLEKIKYAKWKAADIARAIREGRKPAPGPPGSTESEDEVAAELGAIVASQTQLPGPSSPPGSIPSLPSAPSSSYAQPSGADDWSILATPGTELNAAVDREGYPTHGHHSRTSSGSSSKSSGRRSPRRRVHDPDLAHTRTSSPGSGATTPDKSHSPSRKLSSKPPSPKPSSRNSSPGSGKKVHFTPSVLGGTSFDSGSPTAAATTGSSSTNSSSASWLATSHASPPGPPTTYPSRHAVSQPPAPVAAAPLELTPALISKVQKHCRFAISSLDYEDAEQAKKELRTALAMLGG